MYKLIVLSIPGQLPSACIHTISQPMNCPAGKGGLVTCTVIGEGCKWVVVQMRSGTMTHADRHTASVSHCWDLHIVQDREVRHCCSCTDAMVQESIGAVWRFGVTDKCVLNKRLLGSWWGHQKRL
jgi:hypothetical protein